MFNELYTTWAQLGVGFLEKPAQTVSVDLEKTIVMTSHLGRQDSRLLFGMRAWLLKHHGLVNNSRLIRLVKLEKETAVLGGIIDSVLQEIPRSTLRYVRKYCKKAMEPEFVFSRIASSKVQSALNRNENLPIWEKWNLISREMSAMEGAVMDKPFVFTHNHNLVLRALFGPIVRADVLSFLMEQKQSNPHQIACKLGLSYEPVYSELTTFKEIGFIDEEKQGLARMFKIKTSVKKHINTLLEMGAGSHKVT